MKRQTVFTILSIACAGLLLHGCGESKQIDVDSNLMLGGLSSKDFRGVCFKMTQSLISLSEIQNAKRPPRIAFSTVTNDSDEIIDTKSFLEKMRTELIKNSNGKVVFLDRQILQQTLDERDMKDAGQFTGDTSKQIRGADYFLAGTITGITNARGRKSTSYMRMAFRLTNANTNEILWEDDYEIQYYNKAGIYDR